MTEPRDKTAKRKRTEEALRESEEKYRDLLENANDLIQSVTPDGSLIYVNRAWRETLGYSEKEIPGLSLMDIIHPDSKAHCAETFQRVMAGENIDRVEAMFVAKDGRTITVEGSVNCSFKDGKPVATRGIFRDITQRKQAEEDMANRLKMESAVASASNLLAGPEDTDAALNLALRILAEAVGADRAHIFLFRDNNTRMDNTSEWCAPGIEPRINHLQDIDFKAFPWWIDRLSQNEPIIIANTSAAPPDAVTEKKRWKALNIHSLLAVPLFSRGKPIGYVRFANVESASNERGKDIRLPRFASESIASFIERQRAGEEKRKAYESMVMLLATGAEARDPYTEHHLPRIRGFAEAIAAELGLPPDEIREIGLCSLLHDLGKMRVPDSILTKPGPLSQAEWKIIKQHPTWGKELLATHPWLETARQIARWHHERWDGAGYPDGIRGEEIPLCAAIVAVADSFDAMTSDRPYKKAWPPRRAIQEIRAQKGRQYSPDVVEAFNCALRKGEIGRITSADSARPPEMSEAA